MRASAKAPLVLAAIAVALGGYILLVERHRTSTDQARASRLRLLRDLNRADVTGLEIEHNGDQGGDRHRRSKVVLARTGGDGRGAPSPGDWRLEPGGMPAAPAAVGDLLDTLDGIEVDRESTGAPDTTGLAEPSARLVITTPARRWVIALGHPDASGRGVFAQVEGDARTMVVSRRLLEVIDGGGSEFRERRLLGPGLAESASALAFESRGKPRETLRKRSGLWLNNDGFFAARAAAGEALAALAGLQASSFPTAPARPAGAADRSLELTTTDHRTRLDIWDGRGQACAGAERGRLPEPLAELTTPAVGSQPTSTSTSTSSSTSTWVCLDGGAVDRLWRVLDAARHRETHLLVVDPLYADGVILSEGDRRVHLRRDSNVGWRITEPAVSYAADPRAIDDWLTRLAEVNVLDHAPPGAARGDHRRLVLEGPLNVTIDVARVARDALVRVERAGEVGAGAATATLFTEVDPDPLRFRARAVLSLPRFDITGVDVSSADVNVHLRLRRGPGETWIASEGDALPEVDTAALDRLLGAVTDLQAERFLPSTPGSMIAQRFQVERTLDFELREGATPRHQRLELGRACLVRLPDTPVFEVGANPCADLRLEVTRPAPK